jgi:hypothetical protein
MTLRDRIEAAPDKLAAARVALQAAEALASVAAFRAHGVDHNVEEACDNLRLRIRALRDSLGGEG